MEKEMALEREKAKNALALEGHKIVINLSGKCRSLARRF